MGLTEEQVRQFPCVGEIKIYKVPTDTEIVYSYFALTTGEELGTRYQTGMDLKTALLFLAWQLNDEEFPVATEPMEAQQ